MKLSSIGATCKNEYEQLSNRHHNGIEWIEKQFAPDGALDCVFIKILQTVRSDGANATTY